MKTKLQKFTVIFILILVTLPAVIPLLRPGFFTMHDDQQIIRLAELDESLRFGQFPVRWVARLGFGFGYPLFNFYPPFVYYLGEMYHLLFGISFIVSIKLVFATAFVGSAITMYLWASRHFGTLSGILAAMFYTYAPYHALDAYVRGALAELFSFVWLPLLLLSVDQIAFNKKSKAQMPWLLSFTLAYAGLMLTHNLILLPFTGIIGFYVLLRFLYHKPSFLTWIRFGSSIFIALALTAFFWLPALAEKQFTLVNDILLKENYTYSLHYVYPEQLWNSLWGFGGSTAGKLDGFSFKIGKLHLVLAAFTFFVSLIYLSIRKRKSSICKSHTHILASSFLLLAVSAFMTTENSAFIWQTFPPLQYMQFPWRFLTFTALFSSFLAGASVFWIQKILGFKPVVFGYFAFIAFLLLIPNLKLFQPQHYIKDVTDLHYTSDDFAKWHISKTSFEFVPHGVKTVLEPPLNITQLAIQKDQIATSVFKANPEIKRVKELITAPHCKKLEVENNNFTKLQFNTFNFPGWSAVIDGNPAPIDDNNDLKLVTLNLTPGKHLVEIIFNRTPVRVLADTITLFGIFLIGIISASHFNLFSRFKSLLKSVKWSIN